MHIYFFDKYFHQYKKSKLYFRDRVVVQNDFFFEYGGSICLQETTGVCIWTNYKVLFSSQKYFWVLHRICRDIFEEINVD